MMKRLTTTEVAERLGVGKSTVNLWCNQGHFPNAQSESTPRGPVWYIPESDLTVFVQPTPGRPPGKPSAANKAATQPANGSLAALTAAKAKKRGKK
jgi:excisionase family DNA binding protein